MKPLFREGKYGEGIQQAVQVIVETIQGDTARLDAIVSTPSSAPKGFLGMIFSSPELREEGLVREVIRVLQQARKQKDLNPGEWTTGTVSISDEYLMQVVKKNIETIRGATSLSKLTLELGEERLTVRLGYAVKNLVGLISYINILDK
jgi:hypothetical protein